MWVGGNGALRVEWGGVRVRNSTEERERPGFRRQRRQRPPCGPPKAALPVVSATFSYSAFLPFFRPGAPSAAAARWACSTAARHCRCRPGMLPPPLWLHPCGPRSFPPKLPPLGCQSARPGRARRAGAAAQRLGWPVGERLSTATGWTGTESAGVTLAGGVCVCQPLGARSAQGRRAPAWSRQA
jgi:hypothetical protein